MISYAADAVNEFTDDETQADKLLIRATAVPKDTVTDFRDFLKSMDLTPVAMDSNPNAIRKLFRDGIIKIAATKVSAGVSTGIGDHESKYNGSDKQDIGDEQFEIADARSFDQMYNDVSKEGLQPVLNDYVYV